MTTEQELIDKVLDYWNILELLNQDTLPNGKKEINEIKEAKKHASNSNLKARKSVGGYLNCVVQNIPESLSEFINSKIKVLCSECGMSYWGPITVYGGEIKREECIEEIIQLLHPNEEYQGHINLSYDTLAEFVFQIQSTGEYVDTSFQYSPILFAINQLRNKCHDLSEAAYKEYCLEKLDIIMEKRIDDTPYSIALNDIARLLPNGSLRLLFKMYKEKDDAIDEDPVSLSMNFYSEDISLIKTANRLGKLSTDLKNYILAPYYSAKNIQSTSRIDIVKAESSTDYAHMIAQILSPMHAPLGKWPSKFSPALMQQIAINLLISPSSREAFKATGKIFSVNGPPGTGKTTLLKEIIVNNIVEKAHLLSQYDNADDAFDKHGLIGAGSYGAYLNNWYSLKNDDINNFGILVTSCNNAAVENISKELPLSAKILKDVRGISEIYELFNVDQSNDTEDFGVLCTDSAGKKYRETVPDIYFSHYATDLFNSTNNNKQSIDPAWGLVAAPLGKTSNIKAFCYHVLNKVSFFSNNELTKRRSKYADTLHKFRSQYSRVVNERQKHYERIANEVNNWEQLRKIAENEGIDVSCNNDPDSFNQTLSSLRESQQHYHGLISVRQQEINSFNHNLGFFSRLFKTKFYHDTMLSIQTLQQEIQGYIAKTNTIERIISGWRKYNSALAEFTQLFPSNDAKKAKQRIINREFADAILHGDITESTNAHITNPWFADSYNRDREKLFYYALKLNKEFVMSSKYCRTNLKLLCAHWGDKIEVQNGQYQRVSFVGKESPEFFTAIFQTLFLLVPVVSSTFAAIGRFLKPISQPAALGLLIVDEAGQAQPHMALGSLFRTRQAMIVGDPKQIEPVVTDDLKLLKDSYTDPIYNPYKDKTISVQSCADFVNPFGTFMNQSEKKDWVGCPLIVHRRCIDPMFTIANQLSYSGLMKIQTSSPDEDTCKKFAMTESIWIQVDGEENGGKDHYVKAQGEVVKSILRESFIKHGVDNEGKQIIPDLFIISPFTSVVKGIKDDISKAYPPFPLDRIGTVHTFQGKEAHEVIFLLGCDTGDGASGAIQWVNNNIVNVAITRAKSRIYIIGDHNAWQKSLCVNFAYTILEKDGKVMRAEQLNNF